MYEATLVAYQHATEFQSARTTETVFTLNVGTGKISWDTKVAGLVSFYVYGGPLVGVEISETHNVTFTPDIPAEFLLTPSARSQIINKSMEVGIDVYDQYRNKADAADLGVEINVTGTVSGSDIKAPISNPYSHLFSNGIAFSMEVSSVLIQEMMVIMTTSTPLPPAINIDDSIVLTFTEAPLYGFSFPMEPRRRCTKCVLMQMVL